MTAGQSEMTPATIWECSRGARGRDRVLSCVHAPVGSFFKLPMLHGQCVQGAGSFLSENGTSSFLTTPRKGWVEIGVTTYTRHFRMYVCTKAWMYVYIVCIECVPCTLFQTLPCSIDFG